MIRLALALALSLLPGRPAAQGPAPFPHDRHAKLFPTCSGCHAGIATGQPAAAMPAPALCAACHDGAIQPRVSWTGAKPKEAGLLVFSHPRHLTVAKQLDCATCHATGDGAPWMQVVRAEPARCLGCHAHAAPAHLADANVCSRCHRTLAEAPALTAARIAAFPKIGRAHV